MCWVTYVKWPVPVWMSKLKPLLVTQILRHYCYSEEKWNCIKLKVPVGTHFDLSSRCEIWDRNSSGCARGWRSRGGNAFVLQPWFHVTKYGTSSLFLSRRAVKVAVQMKLQWKFIIIPVIQILKQVWACGEDERSAILNPVLILHTILPFCALFWALQVWNTK